MTELDSTPAAAGELGPPAAGSPRSLRLAFAVFFLAYAAFMLGTLGRYGPTWDVQAEYPRATAYLARALGEHTPSGISPWHRLSFERARASHFTSVNGCLPSLVAAATGRIAYEQLGILGYIDAYHLGLTLLWLLFLLHFHWRLGTLHGPRLALLATVLLALAPRLVGHAHNNMRDLPALAFGTSAWLELAVAVTRNRPRQVYAAAVFFGCAVSSKFVAGIVAAPAAVLLWLGFGGPSRLPRIPRSFWLPLAGVPIVSLLVLVGHYPYLWAPPSLLVERIESIMATIARREPPHPPSPYPFVMATITTPLIVLLGTALAPVFAFLTPASRRSERVLLGCYAAWVGIVLAVFSSGLLALFDGIRHFAVFFPPLTILSAWGLLRASDFLTERLQGRFASARNAGVLLAALVLLSSLIPVALYHPYEVTYYNALVGGLPGATRIRFGPEVVDYTPGDYWGTSVRPAVEWANEHLPEGAAIWISLPPGFHHVLPLRSDLVLARPGRREPGRAHYLVFLNRESWFRSDEKDAIARGERVHQEAVRGVPLAFVYRLADRR